jgi:hypothetical protein
VPLVTASSVTQGCPIREDYLISTGVNYCLYIQGKGTEIITGYPRAKLQYLAIPNIHAVRESYDSLRSLCLSMTSSKWHSSLENTQWLNYLSLILKV